MLNDVLKRVEVRLEAVKLSAAAASRQAGLSEDAIRNLKRAVEQPGDRKGVSTRTIAALAPVLHTTTGWLLDGIGPEEIAPNTGTFSMPLILFVNAGRMRDQLLVEPGDMLRSITVSDLPPGDWVALEVSGNSMDRVAPHGSIICVNRKDKRLLQDRFYVFAYDDGASTFKRYKSDPDRFVPYSHDPDEETVHPDGDWTVFGRVKRVIADLD